MSKKTKAASSSRAQVGAFGSATFGGDASSRNPSSFASTFGATPASQLSYVYEPPDLNAISDPTVVVAWKNLQKKDSTTKTRALDDLLAYVSKVEEDKQTLEDGFLDAWVHLSNKQFAMGQRLTPVCRSSFSREHPSTMPGKSDNDRRPFKAT